MSNLSIITEPQSQLRMSLLQAILEKPSQPKTGQSNQRQPRDQGGQ
jgi:hypothetical protein